MFLTANGLEVLFIGNFTEISPPQALMAEFANFLQYSVDVDKLIPNFKLLVNTKQSPLGPENKLFDALQLPPFDKHFSLENVARINKIGGC